MQQVNVIIKGLINLRVEQLNAFQEDIKILTEAKYQSFKKEILADGFAFSPHVWLDQDGHAWLLDGHQRRTALLRLKEEGYVIPVIPCMEVVAESLEHARRLVLAGTSQYGDFQLKNLAGFVKKIGIESEETLQRFSLPTVNLAKLTAVSSQLRKLPNGAEEKEITFDHKCPKCGHEFDGE